MAGWRRNTTTLMLAESGAIIEYFILTYGGGQLAPAPGGSSCARYIEPVQCTSRKDLKKGSPVLIVDCGRPVARLEPVRLGEGEQDGRLSRLIREGIVRPGRASIWFAVPRSATAAEGRRLGCSGPPCRAAGQPAGQPVKFWDASAVVPLLVADAFGTLGVNSSVNEVGAANAAEYLASLGP